MFIDPWLSFIHQHLHFLVCHLVGVRKLVIQGAMSYTSVMIPGSVYTHSPWRPEISLQCFASSTIHLRSMLLIEPNQCLAETSGFFQQAPPVSPQSPVFKNQSVPMCVDTIHLLLTFKPHNPQISFHCLELKPDAFVSFPIFLHLSPGTTHRLYDF